MELPYIYNKENRPFINKSNKSKEIINIKGVIDNLNNKINSLGHKRRKSKSLVPKKVKEKRETNTSKNDKSVISQENKLFKRPDVIFKGSIFPRDLDRNSVEEKYEIYKKNKMLKTPASLFDVMKEIPHEDVKEY